MANPAGWLSYNAGQLAAQVATFHEGAAHLLALLVVMGLMVVVASHWRSRRLYQATVALVLCSLLLVPLMQASQVNAFAAELKNEQDQQQAVAAQAEAQQNAIETLKQQPAMDPHQQPTIEAAGLSAGAVSIGEAQSLEHVAAQPLASDDSGVDTDGDGLTDADELEEGSCPGVNGPSKLCAGVANPADTDDDGLSDSSEVKKIGTLPTSWDSDGDTIADALEIKGFSYKGQSWYLNPGESDSNGDDLLDSVECPVWTKGSAIYNANGICPDTDGDGAPDVWDDDNDDDDVVDALDLDSSTSVGGFSEGSPLSLNISSLTTNEPAFVDIQLRPTDAEHLGYMSSVLDWPSGDTQGQIQRRLDTTFATTDNSSLRSSDANAGNGDIRLAPMLEITIPYQAGHYANLPVKPAYRSVARTPSMRVDTWLDTSVLSSYGITVRDADDSSGELLVYVPISPVSDSDTGMNVAYTARMLYWPSQSGWGSAQEYRVVWFAQMLTDECIDSNADTDTCTRQDTLQLLHTYDESWSLTGLAVREDHGLKLNILYEDPNQDPDLAKQDDLWAASWNLSNTWLRGRDCDVINNNACQGNGSRDVTVDNMESTLDSWSAPEGGDAIEALYAHLRPPGLPGYGTG